MRRNRDLDITCHKNTLGVICPYCFHSQHNGFLEHTVFDNDYGHADCNECDGSFEFERKDYGTPPRNIPFLVYTTWKSNHKRPELPKPSRAKFWELDGVWYIETIDEKARFKALFGSEIIKSPFPVDTPKEYIAEQCGFTFID